MENQPNLDSDIRKFMNKIKEIEKSEKIDLSSDEDLSIGIMNLISIEEHLFFTANKTGKLVYYEILKEVRDMRKSLLKRIIKDYEGEVWCISKHLLASCMRLMEVGTKLLSKNDKLAAEDMFNKAYKLYSLFWGLNLKLISGTDFKEEALKLDATRNYEELAVINKSTQQSKTLSQRRPYSLFDKLGTIVKKAVDCCKE